MPVSLIFGFFILLNAGMMWMTAPGSVSVGTVFGALMVTAIMFGVLYGAAKLLDEDIDEQASH